MEDWFSQTLLMLIPFIFSLTIHEFAHARTALAFGDPTAKNMGRCTLNPQVHLDILGTLCLVFAGFGWAKPVPVNPYNLHPRRLGDIMVSLAGPLSNLAVAVALCITIRSLAAFNLLEDMNPYVWHIMWYTMLVNVVLCIFNMIPLYPLDGHHILRELIPSWQVQDAYMNWQMKYGRLILMGLIIMPKFVPQYNLLGWLYSFGYGAVLDFLTPSLIAAG